MKKIFFSLCCVACCLTAWGQTTETRALSLTLQDAIKMAQKQSVDAAVALNELKTAYWEYRTYRADLLPEITFQGNLPTYKNNYSQYQQSDGTYTYVENNLLGIDGSVAVTQPLPFTGGSLSFVSSLDFSRQFGDDIYNEYLSIPFGIQYDQPIFAVNDKKWQKRIEPIRYEEAKAAYMESVEKVTLTTINDYFSLLLACENLTIAQQNLENANKLYEIAIAKREIGQISQSDLMQLKQSTLQAKANLTQAQSNVNAMTFQLSAFLGLEANDRIIPQVPETFASVHIEYQDVLLRAQANNALAKNILRRQLESQYEVAAAKGNRYQINLSASIGYTGQDNTLNRAYHDLRDNQMLGLGVSVPLVDWGKRKGKIKVAESNNDIVMSQTRREQIDFNQDIFLLVERFNNQSMQLDIAKEVNQLAQQRYETSIQTFMIGDISILDLNDAQASKDEARQSHIEALFYYWYYYYNIRSVSLYDFLNERNLDADFEQIAQND